MFLLQLFSSNLQFQVENFNLAGDLGFSIWESEFEIRMFVHDFSRLQSSSWDEIEILAPKINFRNSSWTFWVTFLAKMFIIRINNAY